MPAAIKYPREIKVGSAVVKIYRLTHKSRGTIYQLAWRNADGKRMTPQFAVEADAEKEARLQASKLSKGYVDATELTASDRDELVAIRKLCNGTPALAAIKEWAEARVITGGQVLAAAQMFAVKNAKGFKPILADECVDKFIAAKNEAGTDADRTYKSKLKPIKTSFAGRELHTISTAEWQQYLRQWKDDGVTHNDFRKRAISMCTWAQKQGYLPRGVDLEIALTEKLEEADPEVGIITPDTYGRLLSYIHQHHPHHLAALVLAGLAIRSDEIHGKREDGREKRQLWEDVHFEEMLVTVTNAKKNTPSWRTVQMTPAAAAWLKLCPEPHQGPVCDKGAIERIREIGINAGLKLPDNCFRHSAISYQVVSTGDKQKVATWAGTSIERIDRNYRRPVFAENGERVDFERPKPLTKTHAAAWFEMSPEKAAALPDQLPPPATDMGEIGRLGGLVKSEAKTLAVTANAEKARAAKLSSVAAPPTNPVV